MIFVHRSNIVVSTGISAGNLDVGTEVLLNESGQPVNYLIVNQGIPENSPLYDASCDGTWILRKDIRELGAWNASGVNTLPGSTIMTTMAGYVDDYDPKVQEAIKTVKIPYCVGNGSATVNSGANGLECKVFPLGGYELGWTQSDSQNFPVDGARLIYFLSGNGASAKSKRIGNYGGVPKNYWTRSSLIGYSNSSKYVQNDGAETGAIVYFKDAYYFRNAMILPYDFKFTDAEVVA